MQIHFHGRGCCTVSEQPKKIPCGIGLLAHVDAGKTTLSEAMLYVSGARRTLGRVDHANAFLDTHALERARGITIFSKQARLSTPNRTVTLVDTPGHVDFAAETERVLPILDCAVLVISGSSGIQAHTLTLWNLLERYQVPTFLFISKMDLPGKTRQEHLAQLQERFSQVDFSVIEALPFPYAWGNAVEQLRRGRVPAAKQTMGDRMKKLIALMRIWGIRGCAVKLLAR